MATISLQTVYPFRTSAYANSIYIYGTKNFNQIGSEYYIPVEKFAAATYFQWQLDDALTNNYITQQQYDETMSYRTTI